MNVNPQDMADFQHVDRVLSMAQINRQEHNAVVAALNRLGLKAGVLQPQKAPTGPVPPEGKPAEKKPLSSVKK